MIINRKDLVLGYPATQWKKVFKASGGEEHNLHRWINFIRKFIDVKETEAKELFQKALKDKYLQETEPNHDGARFYCCGLNGAAIANAYVGKRISWGEANDIYEEFLERVKFVLEDDNFHYYVDNLILFGSFLANKDEVSDIDITLTLKKKTWIGHEETQKKIQNLVAALNQSLSSMDYIYLPYEEVKKYLKSGNRRLSLVTDEIDNIIKQVNHRYIIKDEKFIYED